MTLKKAVALTVSMLGGASGLAAEEITTGVDAAALRAEKVTPLGLYLSSREAFDILETTPETLFIDVRDPVEISQSGYPKGIDAIVPIRLHSDVFDEEIDEFALLDNPGFMPMMDVALQMFRKSKDDMIIVTCGSGWRSALAVRKLAEAGFTNVWHIVDGYEGEEKRGRNSANAWQLAGLPWSTNQQDIPGAAWGLVESSGAGN